MPDLDLIKQEEQGRGTYHRQIIGTIDCTPALRSNFVQVIAASILTMMRATAI